MKASPTQAAVLLWSRTELRRRWRSLVVLGLLAGLAAGLVMAAVEGAERTASAYSRMRSSLLAADAVFYPSQVGIYDADLTTLDRYPEVAAWAGFTLVASQFLGLPPGSGPFVLTGDAWFDTIERAKVLAGRLPDPAKDDEMVVNEATLGFEPDILGRELDLRTLTPGELERYGEAGPPDWTLTEGPATKVRVVGVVRLPLDPVVSFATGPLLMLGPGWAAAHLDQVAPFFHNALVRLRHGAADLPAFREHVAETYGRDDIPIQNLADDAKRVQQSLALERTALLLFVAAVLIASLVLVGQAFLRSAQAGTDAIPALNSLGLGPRDLITGLALPHLLTAVVAAGTTLVATAALSGTFPIGLARRLDPDPGLHLRPGYLIVGALAVVLASVAAAIAASWLAVQASLGRRRVRRTRVVGVVTRAGAPVPAAVGASLALEQPALSGGAQVRPALMAGIAGVLGVVGAFTLVAGIDDALTNPSRAGITWDVELLDAPREAATSIGADARVRDVTIVDRLPTLVSGQEAPVYALDHVKGNLTFTVLHGREPAGADEIMLGTRTAKQVGASIGDEVEVGKPGRALRVVGIGLLAQTAHSSFDEGALVSASILPDVAPPQPDDSPPSLIVLGVEASADRDAVIEDLNREGLFASPPTSVQDVTNLSNVRRLPYLLAGFLVMLGLGAAGHALLTVSRRRRKELAVLRSLGLTPGQAGSCVAWQAVVVAGIALLIGIPLGLAAGRETWRLVADGIPLVYVVPGRPIVIALAVPVVLVALLMLALPPARMAARVRTAEVLRSE